MERIVVTGATGFLGRNLMPILQEKYGVENVVGLSSKDYNLMIPEEVKKMFEEQKPTILIHLAAYSGGIEANRLFPADFFYKNILLTTLVFHEAAMHKVKKMIYPIGGCSYPANAKSPIDETQMWEGFPQIESAGYAIAKKTGIVASLTYRQQYNLNSVVVIPGNMYGEYDNFNLREAHVIPACIRKIYEAKINNLDEVVIWGSGKPIRDFVYVKDVANIILWFIENFNETGPINISTGIKTSIKDLVEMIKGIIDYKGRIRWDTTKPDGQMEKIFNPAKLNSLGLYCKTPLIEGLRKTIAWFEKNYALKTPYIRI